MNQALFQVRKTSLYLKKIGAKFDDAFSSFYLPALAAALLVLLVVNIIDLQQQASAWNGWLVGDWLINFSAGFARRGLLGELILFVALHLGIAANYVAAGLQVLACFSFFLLFFLILRNRVLNFWYLFLCTSPPFLMFYVFDENSIARKEMLLFVVFAAWVLCLQKRRVLTHTVVGLFAAEAVLLTLSHELTAFYSVYFLLPVYFMFGYQSRFLRVSLIIPGLSFIALLVLSITSVPLNDPQICARLLDIGATDKVCSGILGWPIVTISDAVHDFANVATWTSPVVMLFMFIAFAIPAVIFMSLGTNSKISASVCLLLLFCLFLLSLPLFLLAIDWGRWVNIHAILTLLSLSVLLPRKPGNTPDTKAVGYGRNRVSVSIVLGFMILGSSAFWSIPHCCRTESVELGGIAQLVLHKISQ